MTTDDFLKYVRLLTGTDVKGEDRIDQESLDLILRDDTKQLDCSHFNELLLLVHKDRVELPFFKHFFGLKCLIENIPSGVEKFQKTALLLYGNFVFAYRTLSRIKDAKEFRKEITEANKNTDSELNYFLKRPKKLLDIDKIQKSDTPFVGYLSANEVVADLRRCELLRSAAKETELAGTWDSYIGLVKSLVREEERGPTMAVIENFQAKNGDADVSTFGSFLTDSLDQLEKLKAHVDDIRSRATRNQSTYLTWDHMDVYFATSMRKAWEYEDLSDFIECLMASDELKQHEQLNLRYFDPTQAFTDNRVNKGLVEALMLKRARCTVYSVQDTDTLGKDSELASTLAQGKPVIAYVPDINIDKRVSQLLEEDPTTILERLRFVLYADEQLADRLTEEEYGIVSRVEDNFDQFCGRRIWLSFRDEDEVHRFRDHVGQDDLKRFCQVIANSEKAVYDKRANTLMNSHPLAIQVNLDSGVANGVLVVRTIPKCASLLRRVLLADMKFTVKEEDEEMWYLREEISQCIYRVVTNDRKLNNCYWNFYLR